MKHLFNKQHDHSYVEKDSAFHKPTPTPCRVGDANVQTITMREFETSSTPVSPSNNSTPASSSLSLRSFKNSYSKLFTKKKPRDVITQPHQSPWSPEPSNENLQPQLPELRNPPCDTTHDAERYAAVFQQHAMSLLQFGATTDHEGAGIFFEKAITLLTANGLYCSYENAKTHIHYAHNLNKRALHPEAEFHLRTAIDIYRLLQATGRTKYANALLYLAIVIERQGRLSEAEVFYRAALHVYKTRRLSNDRVSRAFDGLLDVLKRQGRAEEIAEVLSNHFVMDTTHLSHSFPSLVSS